VSHRLYKNYSFFARYEIFFISGTLGGMQYLSQRLASEPVSGRDAEPPRSTSATRQRERLLDATERLIAERGCAGTSIEAIVKAAGVSTITFYEHFQGKEECFVAAFDRAVEQGAGALRVAAAEPPTWPERFCTGLRALLEAIEADPSRARLCLVEAQTGGPALSARFDLVLDRVARELREGRALDTAPATLPPTLEEATAGGLAWLLRERLERGGEDVGALYPKLVDIALAPYLGDGAERSAAALRGDG
jgi:AcrR family transcriptional regulator